MGETDEQMQAQELTGASSGGGTKEAELAGSAQEGQGTRSRTVWAMVRKSDFILHCMEVTGKY